MDRREMEVAPGVATVTKPDADGIPREVEVNLALRVHRAGNLIVSSGSHKNGERSKSEPKPIRVWPSRSFSTGGGRVRHFG